MKTGSSWPSNGARGRRRPAIVAMATGPVVISACGSSFSSSPTTSTTTEPARPDGPAYGSGMVRGSSY